VEQPVADRLLQAAVKRIDGGLSLEFLNPPGRFAVLHREQLLGRPDEVIDRTARELQREAALRGYILDLAECQFSCAQAFRDSTVVFYVTEEDGSYRPPDGRVIEKLVRMNHYRENWGLKDWKQFMQAKADVLREQRERSAGDVWDSIRKDRVFARVASDILWGQKPVRSVLVQQLEDGYEHHLVRPGAADGADAGPGAGGVGSDGVSLRPAEQDPPAAGSGDGPG